jgi:hypothetical protein
VSIPAGVKVIGERAFADNKLVSVTIPDSVTSIGEWAFSSNQLSSVSIPDSVTSIGSSAFADCRALEIIVVKQDENAEMKLGLRWNGAAKVVYDV